MADDQRAQDSGVKLTEEARQLYFRGLKKGRIVYFTDMIGVQCPAIITKVFENSETFQPTGVVNLVVFRDESMCVSYRSGIRSFIDAETKVGCWDWMFEGQGARYTPDRLEVDKQVTMNGDYGGANQTREKS